MADRGARPVDERARRRDERARDDSRADLSRRRFLTGAAAVAAGTVVVGAETSDAFARADAAAGRLGTQPAGLPKRQFAWTDHLSTDEYGNPVAPQFDRLLFFDVRGTPTRAHAQLLEQRLRTLERTFDWSHDGLLFTASWGVTYFERVLGVDSPVPQATSLSSFEFPVIDGYDLCLHLASDDEARLAAIEDALVHGAGLSGVGGSSSLAAGSLSVESALVWRETRTGFTGAGLPAARQGVHGIPSGDPVPASSPLYMGFKSGLRKNQAGEDDVAIESGAFAGGTMMHVSHMRLDLDGWYGKLSEQGRVSRMYSPETSVADVAKLTTDAESEPNLASQAIRRYGVIGHSQATAEARQNNKPLIIRRDFNTDDGGYAGLNFVSVQRSYDDFVVTRNAMNASGAHLQNRAITATRNNGVNAFIDVLRRGNYIMPSRADRSFPLLADRRTA